MARLAKASPCDTWALTCYFFFKQAKLLLLNTAYCYCWVFTQPKAIKCIWFELYWCAVCKNMEFLCSTFGMAIDLGFVVVKIMTLLSPGMQEYSHYTYYIFSCDQAGLRTLLSVCLSVCLSVRLSHLFYYVPIIVSSWNFQELLPLTDVMSMQKVEVRGQRSRSQRSWPHLAVSGP